MNSIKNLAAVSLRNAARKISTGLLLSGLALTALPAGAVTSSGVFFVSKLNNAGGFTTVMRPSATHFCFLTRVFVEETDSAGESIHCRIRAQSGSWILEGILGATADADVQCEARCYTNN